MPDGESRGRGNRHWDSQKRSRAERLQAGGKLARGKMVKPTDATALLGAIPSYSRHGRDSAASVA